MNNETIQLTGKAIDEVQNEIGASSRSDLISLISERARSQEFEFIAETSEVSERTLRKWWIEFRDLPRSLQTRAIIEACAETDFNGRSRYY